MFSAAGVAAPGNPLYPEGEKREFLLFLAQLPATDHDWESAANVLVGAGWNDVTIDRAAVTTPDLSSIDNPTLRDAIAHAAQSGSSIVVYGPREKANGDVDPR